MKLSLSHAAGILFTAAAVWALATAGRAEPDATVPTPPQTEPAPLSPDAPPAPPRFEPPLGTYHYTVRWKKAGVARACLRVSRTNDHYRLEVQARTSKGIDPIYKLRYKGEGTVSTNDLSPIEANLYHRSRKQKKRTRIRFLEDGTAQGIETKEREDRPSKTTLTEADRLNGAVDPFSAALIARNLDWQEGVSEVFEIFVGRRSYEVSLDCLGQAEIEIEDKVRPVWVIRTVALKLDDHDAEPSDRSTRIYISADDAREILRIDSKSKIGRIWADMEKFEPATETGPSPPCNVSR